MEVDNDDKKMMRSIPYIIILILIIVLINVKSGYMAYDDYVNMVKEVGTKFQPEGFISINKELSYDFSKVTSYPNSEWTSEKNNSYKNNAIKPRQIEYYYLNSKDKNVMTKITFFYAPDSKTEDYIKVDYLYSDSLSHISSIDEKYRNIALVPNYEVGFKGKGYYAYVQTIYIEPFYKTTSITKDENTEVVLINADMVRQLQNFLTNLPSLPQN